MPLILQANRHEVTLDHALMQQMGAQGLLGTTLPEKYGGSSLSYVGYGLPVFTTEVERVDSTYRSAVSVQSSLVMYPIAAYAQTEAIRLRYSPELAAGRMIGCFGLTEPNHGSDPVQSDSGPRTGSQDTYFGHSRNEVAHCGGPQRCSTRQHPSSTSTPLRQSSMPLVSLLNMFQSSGYKNKSGHLALVCARPSTGEKAMSMPSQSLPETAGLMDVLESLLQEHIFDEMDRLERKAHHLANALTKKWRSYVRRKKDGLVIPMANSIPAAPSPSLIPVVERAVTNLRDGTNGHTMAFVEETLSVDTVLETTALLLSPPM